MHCKLALFGLTNQLVGKVEGHNKELKDKMSLSDFSDKYFFSNLKLLHFEYILGKHLYIVTNIQAYTYLFLSCQFYHI